MSIAEKIYAIVCDDVRREQGNKISLMGLYDEKIILQDIPAILPKLCIVLFIINIKESFPIIKVRMSLPKADPVDFELPAPKIQDNEGGKVSTDKDSEKIKRLSAQAN